MRFLHTGWLSAGFLLIMPAAVIFWLYTHKRALKDMASLVSVPMFKKMGVRVFAGRKKTAFVLLMAAVSVILFALARPQWGYTTVERERYGVDIMFVLDVSKSMLAEDIKPNRLKRAVLEIKSFLQSVQGDRTGLVLFAGSAFTACPLTTDLGAFSMILEEAGPSLIPQPGTDLGKAIEKALKSFQSTYGSSKVIILVTDGEDHGGRADKAAAAAAEKGIPIHVIGLGSEMGTPIPVMDQQGSRSYLKDTKGETVMTRFNPDSLREIARVTKGTFIQSATGDFHLEDLYASVIDPMEKKAFENRKYTIYTERFQLFLFCAVVLLIMQAVVESGVRTGGRVGKEAVLMLFLFLMVPAHTFAFDTIQSPAVKRLNKLYEKAEYDKAAKGYMALHGKIPLSIGSFNAANAFYKKGSYHQALSLYEKAAQQSEDARLKAFSLYGMGNALYRQGRLKEALEAYAQALTLLPDDEDILYNKEFVEKKIREMEKKVQETQEKQKDQQQKRQEQKGDQQKQQEHGQDGQGKKSEQQGTSGTNKEQENSRKGQDDKQGAYSADDTGKKEEQKQPQTAQAMKAGKDGTDDASADTQGYAGEKQEGAMTQEDARRVLSVIEGEGRPLLLGDKDEKEKGQYSKYVEKYW